MAASALALRPPLAPARHFAARVRVLTTARELAAERPALEALAARALEPNPFFEPWMLQPALASLVAGSEPRHVLVHGARGLLGYFPLETAMRYRGLPLATLRLWRHAHCYLGTPLVDREHAPAALEAFLRWFEHASGAALLELHEVSGEGAFHRALQQVLARRPRAAVCVERYTRALFRPRCGGEAYLRAALPGRRRKELRRVARRLAEQGLLEYRALGAGECAEPWIQSFLELERSGWKGRAGTALGATPAERAFFEALAREGARRERLAMHGLFLDARPLALACHLHAGDGAFAFKIAFDEAYARYSPGLLLELEHIRRADANAHPRWMDSCAQPAHFMANRLWLERRALQHVTLAAGAAGRGVLLARRLWRALRGRR